MKQILTENLLHTNTAQMMREQTAKQFRSQSERCVPTSQFRKAKNLGAFHPASQKTGQGPPSAPSHCALLEKALMLREGLGQVNAEGTRVPAIQAENK